MFAPDFWPKSYFTGEYWPPSLVIDPPQGGPGGAVRRLGVSRPPLSTEAIKRLDRSKLRLRAKTRKVVEEIEAVESGRIDVSALERALEEAALAALADLPQLEPSGRKRRAPLVDIPRETFEIRPVVNSEPESDINLRLLLLLGV